MDKAYIINLKFGITRRQIWFSAEDNKETEQKWCDAYKTLDIVGDACTEPQEFYEKAIAHYNSYGFTRIAK